MIATEGLQTLCAPFIRVSSPSQVTSKITDTKKSVTQARSAVSKKDVQITDIQKTESVEAFFDDANGFKDPLA